MQGKTKVIGKDETRAWKRRWNKLSATGFRNDYAIAGLAGEIRSEFPDGDVGDEQYIAYVNRSIRGAQGMTMLRMSLACKLFSEAQWGNLGGWRGIRFLSALTLKERAAVLNGLKGPGPHHYTTIRHKAYDLGIVSRLKGRNNHSKSEERAQTLQSYVVSLITQGIVTSLPKRVKEALTVKTRAKLVGAKQVIN
jgi:hypothetical protein